MRYTVLISKSPSGQGYWAMVPALPGCFSNGDTFEVVQANVKTAIKLHIQGMVEDGEEPPSEGDFIVAQSEVDMKEQVA